MCVCVCNVGPVFLVTGQLFSHFAASPLVSCVSVGGRRFVWSTVG